MNTQAAHTPDYWYVHRSELNPGDMFRLADGSIVELDRSVPGDATKWYVVDFDAKSNTWSYFDATIEPGELIGAKLTADDIASATGGQP